MSSPKVNLIVRVTSLNRSQFQSRFISCVKKNYLFRTIMSRMNIVIGQVMKRHKMRPELVKVRYLRLVLDKYLLKYFNKRHQCWAEDKTVNGDIGDVVLIKSLEEQKIPQVRHEVIDMVYKLGAIVDPVTGRRCRGKDYIDEAERMAQKQFIESEQKSS